jgi:ankyrin repeat protein
VSVRGLVRAQNGHTETVRALVLEFGADASTADKQGHTPVFLAVFHGRPETVRTLVLECGVDASTANEWGMSLLHAAAAMDHTESEQLWGEEQG